MVSSTGSLTRALILLVVVTLAHSLQRGARNDRRRRLQMGMTSAPTLTPAPTGKLTYARDTADPSEN